MEEEQKEVVRGEEEEEEMTRYGKGESVTKGIGRGVE